MLICCCCSVAKSYLSLCSPMDCSMQVSSVLHCLPEFAQTHVHWVIDAIYPSHPLPPLLLLPSVFPSIRVFSNELTLHIRWLQGRNFSFSISPSIEYSRLISFRIKWFDPHAVQGTHKSLLQHHCSKASIIWHSGFFTVQLSHLCMTTGKTMALTMWTFVSKLMSLFSNMLSRFVIAFLPRSKYLFISWLQSPSAVILEPEKRKAVTAPTFPTSICHEVMELDVMILIFFFTLLFHSHQEAVKVTRL